MCRGELFQFQDQFNSNQTITNYVVSTVKQHFLFNSTQVGAITNASNDVIRKLKMIGHYIGMSFQIMMMLDFTSSEKKLGKPL